MNILFVGNGILSSTGGGQKVARELAKELKKSGKIYFITGPSKDPTNTYPGDNSIEIYHLLPSTDGRIHPSSLNELSSIFVTHFKLFFVILRIIRREKVDVLYVLGYRYLLPTTWAASLGGVVTVARLTAFISKEYLEFMGFLKFSILRLIQDLIIRLSRLDLIHLGTKHERKDLEKYKKTKIAILPNPIDSEQIMTAKKKTDVRNVKRMLGVTGELFLLYVGRLSPKKGVEQFIKILPNLRRNYKLVIIGDGPEKSRIEKTIEELKIEEKVTLLGFKEHSEVLTIINSCDVLIFPSIVDQSPNVVLEALALNKPVIATHTGGQSENESENLYLVDNLEEMIPLLESDIEEKEDASILQRHSKDKVCAEFKKLLLELLKKKKAK